MSTSTNNKSAFFSSASELPASEKKNTSWVKGPSVYEAMALGVCDKCMTSTLAYRGELDLLMRIYFHLYPDAKSRGLNTSVAQLRKLIEFTASEVLIHQLAQAFYRLTIHGLKEHPTRYHEYALPPETTDWIAKSAPHVISDLGPNIRLRKTASGKPLPASILYEERKSWLILDLQVRHEEYLAKVSKNNMDYFNPYLLRRPTIRFEDDDALAELLLILKAENEVVFKKFEATYTRLLKHVQAGEISKEDLLGKYLERVSAHRFHSTQAFFDSIHRHEEGHDVHLIHELIHVFARLDALVGEAFFSDSDIEVSPHPDKALPSPRFGDVFG